MRIYICTCLKLPTPLLQIYLIIEHHLYQIYLDSSLSGYLSEVSLVKLSKDKKKRNSTLQFRMITVCIGGASFPSEKHALFNDISKDDNNTGIEIKRFLSSENNEEITVNEFSSIKKAEVNFKWKDFQRKPHSVQQVINTCVIYDSRYLDQFTTSDKK